ncbi:hypothetical protein H2200_012198 [Cladophialophora chaetospira]|uniref:Major facilitator superfamily (MFS) profile domain-containing protein n=1 Tax=Cladophialophora chaetospira TaxID=386627 RepID=A0AA38WYD6_9EURO|nr:hypothetical protein H2200_012198 [Cladophialophora chaetospira]
MALEKVADSLVAPVALTDEHENPTPVQQAEYDEKMTKRLIRKIDRHVMPPLVILYLLSFLDRTNIGNARLSHLEEDLNLKGLDYNVALAILYPFYVAAEIPSNLMMKLTRPSLWLPSTMLAWAVCCTLMGLVHNYAGLLAARAALGFAEGGLFPGINFYITMWYQRHECGLRMSVFFSMATAAGAFGGLLARGISEMDGVAGKGGWAWIFILEGIATFVVALWALWAFVDYPDTAKFITESERTEIYRRLEHDRGSLADEFDVKYVKQAFKDWKIYVHCLNFFCTFTSVYSFSLFLPTIIKDLGYTDNKAQLMTVPPYVVACFLCLSAGYASDKVRTRGVIMIGFYLVAIIGLVMLDASHNAHVKYAGTFFFAAGVYPNVPQCMAWNGNNVGGSTKRSVALALQAMAGNLGGILASFIYLKSDSPQFTKGHSILIGLLTLGATTCTLMTTYYRRENARRDAKHKAIAQYSLDEKASEREKGDSATFFRFTV